MLASFASFPARIACALHFISYLFTFDWNFPLVCAFAQVFGLQLATMALALAPPNRSTPLRYAVFLFSFVPDTRLSKHVLIDSPAPPCARDALHGALQPLQVHRKAFGALSLCLLRMLVVVLRVLFMYCAHYHCARIRRSRRLRRSSTSGGPLTTARTVRTGGVP